MRISSRYEVSLPLDAGVHVAEEVVDVLFADGVVPHGEEGLLCVHVPQHRLDQKTLPLVLEGV